MIGREKILRRAIERDFAAIDEHDSLRDPQRFREIVSDEDDRRIGSKTDERVLKLASHDRIERRERLVAQHQRRIGDHRARDADALLLAA